MGHFRENLSFGKSVPQTSRFTGQLILIKVVNLKFLIIDIDSLIIFVY